MSDTSAAASLKSNIRGTDRQLERQKVSLSPTIVVISITLGRSFETNEFLEVPKPCKMCFPNSEKLCSV